MENNLFECGDCGFVGELEVFEDGDGMICPECGNEDEVSIVPVPEDEY
jgi:anaerobic ribonucleoside-triphosphate reductase